MIQLTYVSEARHSLAPDEIFRIIETSARNNLRDGITGFLVFAQHGFFQLVEGPEAAINALIERLQGDPRHSRITVLSRDDIAQRCFPRWQMKRLHAGQEIWRELESQTTDRRLTPLITEALSAFLGSQAAA